jgi:uncharacterized protein (TIGR02246 family)
MTSYLIQSLEQQGRAAMVAGDTAALDELLDPECVYVHTNGLRETKAEYIEMVRSGQYRYQRVTAAELSIRILGDVAVVLGCTTLDVLLPDGSPKRVYGRSIVLWTRRTGPWRLLHYQGTTAPPVEG